MIELKELLMGITANTVKSEIQISGLALDSRCVVPGDLFFALPGTQCNGAQFVSDALARGAAAVLTECDAEALTEVSPVAEIINIEKLTDKVGEISARFYGAPSADMTLIGITGTNGKTSCAYFLNQALEWLGESSALIGTLGYGSWDKLQKTQHTTPDAITLQRILAEIKQTGAQYVAMEVSSHGLQQGRVNGCEIDVAVFTNLTHDHLDYHGDFEQYKAVKQQLFLRPELKSCVFNIDDSVGAEWFESSQGKCTAVSRHTGKADVYLEKVLLGDFGLDMVIHTPKGPCTLSNKNLFGEFNVENLLSVVAVLLELGFSVEQIESTIPKLKGVPGRLEKLPNQLSENQPAVFVDYAHTPNALDNVLRSCRNLVPDHGQVICLFGCGGERDKDKRPLMGEIAQRYADAVVISADNSRSENTLDIVKDILTGMSDSEHVKVIEDRAKAIDYAISLAGKGDLVLLAGKGAETTQTLSQGQFEFSDFQCALDTLNKRGLH